jgi:hypothetical protein
MLAYINYHIDVDVADQMQCQTTEELSQAGSWLSFGVKQGLPHLLYYRLLVDCMYPGSCWSPIDVALCSVAIS